MAVAPAPVDMRISVTGPGPVLRELDLCASLVPLSRGRVLELGCGRAEFTRAVAEAFPEARFVAMEVDATQHAENLASAHPANMSFALGPAQAIPADAGSFDAVLMLKSLHHVPVALLDQALDEIGRVLRPGGLAYVSEPIAEGAFNGVMALFHDEREVRRAAFEALRRAVVRGPLRLAGQHFWQASRRFDGFDDFRARMIDVTHTNHRLAPATLALVRERFERQLDASGVATFGQLMRTDLLRRD